MVAVSAAMGLALAVTASPALAQHDMHAGHGGMTMEGGWRMVPMDPNMPMLPGLADAVPIVGPFMPGMGMDPAMLPEARPSEVVEMADLDTLDISVSMVRRTIAGHDERVDLHHIPPRKLVGTGIVVHQRPQRFRD